MLLLPPPLLLTAAHPSLLSSHTPAYALLQTTLLSILGGRAPKQTQQEGRVRFNDAKLTKRVKRQIGFVLQVSQARCRREGQAQPALLAAEAPAVMRPATGACRGCLACTTQSAGAATAPGPHTQIITCCP